MTQVDDIDRQLLRMLHRDGRSTYSELAPEVGLSVAAVKRRVDRLRETGVITGFTVQVDHTKLGRGIEAFVELSVAGSTPVGDIVRTAYEVPEAQAVFTISGDPDALVHVRVRDIGHLQQVIDGLRRNGHVTGTKTLMVLGSWTKDS
ncbi:Lrp/AsnC family transcriptional regulator [Streptomyces fuscichromogenes]|uniref:AsnC family transcriptional regulator n=1 Tax=Streptomyces fuscichromogenes TaxID=1324013 RepID=A0A917XGI1_9ACTN|nr:Lrp/AsnC family transcriptional regulator [Streptomyces fuscichromogenes]GGN22733.1 AsnC family transcriptional regulator [Streptomyces fuscichromogenes]